MKRIISLLFFLGILILNSCSKKPSHIVESKPQEEISQTAVSNLKKMLNELPMIIRVRDEKNKRFVDFDIRNKTISILKSWSFSNPTPNTVYASANGFVIYVSDIPSSWGFGSGSQTITAGSTTLQVQTICLAVDGLSNQFSSQVGAGAFPDEVALVLGLDADFSMIANADNLCFSDFFMGIAFSEVFSNDIANASYPVIDWEIEDWIDITNKSFAFVMSFSDCNDGNFYFSNDGNINISGGDMTFDGNYFGIEGFSFDELNSVWIGQDNFQGSGTMGCN